MPSGRPNLAIIPARAGSKGLPGKNIIPLRGRPLIAWTVEAARAGATIDRVLVSTDGEAIAEAARRAGAEVEMRPAELATDTAMPKDAVRWHLAEMERRGEARPTVVVLLQPTSPLRLPSDIDACVDPVVRGEADSAATFVASAQSPFRAWLDTEGGPVPAVAGFDPWQPRQALPPTYRLNGAVYAMRTDVFLADASHSFLPGRARMVEMPPSRSHDIDTADDLARVEAELAVRGADAEGS